MKKRPTKAQQQYSKDINSLDVLLSDTRERWMKAASSEEKDAHLSHLNALLDERVILMGARDSS